MKFRTRLFLFYIGGVLIVTTILAAYFFNFEEKRIRGTINDRLLVQAQLAGETLTRMAPIQSGADLSAFLSRTSVIGKARVTVIAPDGTVLGDSYENFREMPNHGNRPEIMAALTGKNSFASRYSETLHENLYYIAHPIRINNQIAAVVRISQSERAIERMLSRMKTLIIGGILLTAILAVGAGYLVIHRLIKPIHELQNLAARVSAGDLSVRVHQFGIDELGELGVIFNDMARRLTDSFMQLQSEKYKLEIILENLADGIIVLDKNLRVLMVNGSAVELLGLDLANITGRPVMEVVLNHHLLDLIHEANQSGADFEGELTLFYPQNRQFQVLIAPLHSGNNVEISGSIVVLHDLTQLRVLERVRQDFVANVSHELRTPITTIKAMSETLLGGGWQESEMLLRFLRATDQECDRLASLIDDLLILAKLDSKPEFRREAFDLTQLIHEVKERFTPLQGKTPNFEIMLPEELPRIDGNRDQIKQVLINLLDNAFKYTPADGEIRLSAWQEANFVKVAIADTGMGIPAAELGRIFERFYRVDKARSRELGGTGLGLSIVKHIVELHSGRVEVESSPGQGSVFSFTLPISAVTPVKK